MILIAFLLLFALFCVLSVKCKLYELEYNPLNKAHNALIFVCAGVGLVISCVIFYLLFKENIAYPFEKGVTGYNAYEQLFDALMKKQLYIDYKPSAELMAMENPYDADLRTELGVSYLWDRAFFDGRFYSYFGIAPIILIYFPFYFITHSIPSAHTVCFIMSAVSVPVITALTVKAQTAFMKKVNLPLLLMSILAVQAGSLVFMVQSSADMYYTAVQSGILFLALFLLFSVCAYSAQGVSKKCVYFALSGVSLAFLAMSRPNLLVYFLLAVPIYLNTLFDKSFTPGKKLAQVMSFAVPAALGAAFVMWYNFARFGSVTDFGANYQMTVHDVSEYSFAFSLFIPSLYYYFIELPGFTADFPYLEIDFVNVARSFGYNGYIYLTSTVGAMSFPAVLGCATAPSVLWGEKNRVKQGFVWLAILTSVFLAFFDTCFAGVNIRYLADIMLVVILLSSLLLCDFTQNVLSGRAAKATGFIISSALLILSFAVGLLLIFNNERDYILKLFLEGNG